MEVCRPCQARAASTLWKMAFGLISDEEVGLAHRRAPSVGRSVHPLNGGRLTSHVIYYRLFLDLQDFSSALQLHRSFWMVKNYNIF